MARWISLAAASASVASETGVALCIHLLAVVRLEPAAHEGARVGEHVGILRAELLEQTGGAFDIGVEEGDDAGGQLRHIVLLTARPLLRSSPSAPP
jgi:hypothetical protein